MRKSSIQVTLLLAAAVTVTGCEDEQKRDIYTSKQDCVKEWNAEDKCEAVPHGHAIYPYNYWYGHASPYYYGPAYSGASRSALSPSRVASESVSISRGGFGATGRAMGGGIGA